LDIVQLAVSGGRLEPVASINDMRVNNPNPASIYPLTVVLRTSTGKVFFQMLF